MDTTLDRALAVVAFLIGMFVAVPIVYAQSSPITIELSQPDQPMTLKVGILSADIVVIGEARGDVELVVEGGESERRIVTPSGSKAITGGSYRLSATEDNNVVEVGSDWRNSTLQVVIRVPEAANVELWTTNNGTILVRGISGEMQLQNTNGPVTVEAASGPVIAESVNDDISVSFSDLNDIGATSLTSVNGSLTIGLPESASAEVHLDTARGDITSDFEIDIQPSAPKVSRTEDRGTIEVSVENAIIANVNGGGPVIRMKTLNGDIQINRTP
ncbi:MAG: DUF4097 family beta strand repeat-containing protein [Pseudomonadota bacterium]